MLKPTDQIRDWIWLKDEPPYLKELTRLVLKPNGYTIGKVRESNNALKPVAIRRLCCEFLHLRGWGYREIGRFMDMDHKEVARGIRLHQQKRSEGKKLIEPKSQNSKYQGIGLFDYITAHRIKSYDINTQGI